MKKKITVTLNRISFQEEIGIDSIKKNIDEYPYNEEEGVGFINTEIFENVLETTLIKRIPTSLQEFVPLTGDFIRRNIFVFDEITFYIDLENNLIYSFSPTSKLNKVKSELRNVIKSKVIYENVILNPKKVISGLIANGFESTINEIVIKKFIYNKGAQGKFSAKILNTPIGQSLMEEYLDEIQKITVEVISNHFNDFILTISSNNVLSIKSDEDEFFNILDNLKNKIN